MLKSFLFILFILLILILLFGVGQPTGGQFGGGQSTSGGQSTGEDQSTGEGQSGRIRLGKRQPDIGQSVGNMSEVEQSRIGERSSFRFFESNLFKRNNGSSKGGNAWGNRVYDKRFINLTEKIEYDEWRIVGFDI